MTRFLGLLLMMATGAVFADLLASTRLDPFALGVGLAAVFLTLGLLIGFLATARQFFWAVATAFVIAGCQYYSGRISWPFPSIEELTPWIFLLVPPIAIGFGTFVGTRLLTRRLRALVKPEHDD